jgi:hypothetical protein
MREPSLRARVLASPPVFYPSWALALWLGYEWTQHGDAWPLIVGAAAWLLAVMKAEEQVRAYKAWKREWDAVAGVVSPKRWPVILGAILGIPIFLFLAAIGQQSGTQAVIGVLMITVGALALLGLLAKLLGCVRRRSLDRVEPVTVCVTRPLIPVPTLRDALHSLPEHCLRVLEPLA